ncbi:hypothetical protein ACQP1O_18125 [Nocardia sp. CA-151230]|uniref:hypothetical protein n=1 Tax=Nocardia sp. CA-151230 TaxID=3239982 RepID=UPI003D921172
MATSHDDQLSMDLGVEIRHTDQAWRDWSDPTRRADTAARFRDRIGVTGLPELPWSEDSPELVHITTRIDDLFPDMTTATAPENAAITDEFACFLVDCYERWTGAEVANYPVEALDKTLFPSQPDVNPLLTWPFEAETSTVWGLLYVMTNYGSGFEWLASVLDEYCTSYLMWCVDNDVDSAVRRYVYPDGVPDQ